MRQLRVHHAVSLRRRGDRPVPRGGSVRENCSLMESAVIFAALAVAAAVHAATGFGFALVAVPLLALAADVPTAVVAVGIAGVLLNLGTVGHGWAHVSRPTVAGLLATAIVGVPVGLLLANGVLSLMGAVTSDRAFLSWGWRVPFLVSIVLVVISLFIRLRLRESPLFAHLKTAGRTSTAPVSESFGSWSKWQTVLTVLWGAAAGQAVVWYCGQFYALFWLQNPDLGGVSSFDTNLIIVAALALATPFFIVFGALSDRVGRKPLVYLSGALMSLVCLGFIFYQRPLAVPIAALCFGVGYGAYTSVDWALACDVLPRDEDAGRDMGIWAMMGILPQVVGILFGGALLSFFKGFANHVGYTLLFCLTLVYFVLGTALVCRVRGTR